MLSTQNHHVNLPLLCADHDDVFFNSHVQYICIVGIRQSRNLPLRVPEYWKKWSICSTCHCFMSIFGDKTQEDLPLNQHVDLTTSLLVHWVGFLVKAIIPFRSNFHGNVHILAGILHDCSWFCSGLSNHLLHAWFGTIQMCFPNHRPPHFS